jgi:hypothetical protein
MNRPWMQFHTRDWLDNKELRRCSLAARAILTDLMALAHEGFPYGFLADKIGPLTVEYMASRCFVAVADFASAVEELKSHGRVSVDDDSGALYIERMVQDEASRAKRAEAGSKGGNPRLLRDPIRSEVNHEDNQGFQTKSANQGLPRSDSDSIGVVSSLKDSKKENLREIPVRVAISSVGQRFDEFWDKWPRQVGRDAALSAWQSVVTPLNEGEVFDCLDRFLASRDFQNGAIPNAGPSTGRSGWLFDCSRDNWRCNWPRARDPATQFKTKQQENADAWDRA